DQLKRTFGIIDPTMVCPIPNIKNAASQGLVADRDCVREGSANGRQQQTGRQEQLSPADRPDYGGSALYRRTARSLFAARLSGLRVCNRLTTKTIASPDDATDWRQIAAKQMVVSLIPTMQPPGGRSSQD